MPKPELAGAQRQQADDRRRVPAPIGRQVPAGLDHGDHEHDPGQDAEQRNCGLWAATQPPQPASGGVFCQRVQRLLPNVRIALCRAAAQQCQLVQPIAAQGTLAEHPKQDASCQRKQPGGPGQNRAEGPDKPSLTRGEGDRHDRDRHQHPQRPAHERQITPRPECMPGPVPQQDERGACEADQQ
jgi:hypothetical protein